MCLETRHRWSRAVSEDYILGESGNVQELCQCLNPLVGGSWSEWEEENMGKSCDTPALGWDLSQSGKQSLKGCLLTNNRGVPLETCSGNGFLSTSRKAISGAEKKIFNEGKTVRKINQTMCVFCLHRLRVTTQGPKRIRSGQMEATSVFPYCFLQSCFFIAHIFRTQQLLRAAPLEGYTCYQIRMCQKSLWENFSSSKENHALFCILESFRVFSVPLVLDMELMRRNYFWGYLLKCRSLSSCRIFLVEHCMYFISLYCDWAGIIGQTGYFNKVLVGCSVCKCYNDIELWKEKSTYTGTVYCRIQQIFELPSVTWAKLNL